MRNSISVIPDPIDRSRKKQDGILGRLFKTRHFGGKGIKRTDPFGHYLFVGKQRGGKTASMIWYMDFLRRKYEKRNKSVVIFSNLGIGRAITRATLSDTIHSLDYDPNVVYIFLIDEIQSYFPKDSKDTLTLQLVDRLTGDFSQLGKRQIFVLSTAQVYGRLNKNLREQCLYMVDCRPSRMPFSHKIVNDFILGDDIICDDLGRWSGIPKFIYTHGLSKVKYDTHRMIKE